MTWGIIEVNNLNTTSKGYVFIVIKNDVELLIAVIHNDFELHILAMLCAGLNQCCTSMELHILSG